MNKKQARIAGLLYLLASIPAFFAWVYVLNKLIVTGDATATANNVRASETLLRLSIGSELTGSIIFIFVVLALYQLFKPVSQKHALAMATLLLISLPISFCSVVSEMAALIVASGASFLSAFDQPQRDTLALSVWSSCHSIRFHPALPGLLALHCWCRLCRQFSRGFASAGTARSRCSICGHSSNGGTTDNLLAFDLGCKGSTIRQTNS
jgi:hypothetical protein